MAAGGEHGKQQAGRHALAVGLHRQVHEITQPGKLDHIGAKRLKSPQIAVHEQVVGLDGLQATELRAGDEALVDHRKHPHPRLKVTPGVQVDPGDQAQKGALTGAVVADQGHPLPFPHRAGNILKGSDNCTATATPQLAAGDGSEQGAFETAGLGGEHRDVQPHMAQVEHHGPLGGWKGLRQAGSQANVAWRG